MVNNIIRRSTQFAVGIVLTLAFLQGTTGCKHDPITTIVDPVDTTGMDTITDPTDTTFIPCDSNTVYFNRDVLPILVSNCSVPGCHNDSSAEQGVILTSYENVINTTDVEPFNLEDTEIYEVLFLNDPEDRMPPDPREKLNQEQLEVITRWILQGAENLTCDEDTTCNTENVSFANDVYPIIEDNCRGCHSGPAPSGGVLLTDYTNVAMIANSGRLYGAIARLPGFAPMPQNRDRLPDCQIQTIKAWIDDGTPDN